MSATLTAGPSSVLLKVSTPLDTDGITPRDDLIGIKVWYSTSTGFSTTGVTPYYDGTGLTITIPGLTAGTAYYVKYALISEIEPDNYTVSTELTATPTPSTEDVPVIAGAEFVGEPEL